MSIRQTLNAMYGIPDQIPLHGTITTAYTVIGEEGNAAAKSLLAARIFELFDQSRDERSFVQAIDALSPSTLAARAMTSVMSLSDCGDPPTTVTELKERHKLLRDVESGNTTPATRTMHDCVKKVVDDQREKLSQNLLRVFDACPASVCDAVAEVRERFQEFLRPAAGLKHLPKLSTVLRTLQEFSQFENEFLPEIDERVRAALLQEARTQAEKAFREVIERKVCKLLEQLRAELEAALKDLESRAQRFRQVIGDIHGQFVERQKELAREEEDRVSTACLSLPSPDKEQVLTGMKSALGCSDLAELANQLASQFEARLREHAKRVCPYLEAERASVPALMLEATTADLTQLIDDTVEDNLGNGHSLYELVDAYGVERAVKYLYERAGPTCSFSGRDCETLGVSPDELSIVRLPRARSPDDERIRTRIKNHFKKLPKCHVDEEGETGREILLSRVHCGWPIGIESANSALHMAYIQSADHGHIPHLLQFLPDSPLGRIVPALRGLPGFSRNGKEKRDA